jgi:catechol 2,3-dioxygenase-like lactoylglutathione lyase family enzyme
MAKVLGVGGVFFKTKDPAALKDWYTRVLGLEVGDWGVFFTPDMVKDTPGSGTVFSAFKAETDYFLPSDKEFMFNLIVDDIDAMLEQAKAQLARSFRWLDRASSTTSCISFDAWPRPRASCGVSTCRITRTSPMSR